jgi:hypothetical protein
MADINNLPDISLDSIEDLPGFEVPPQGRYLCLLTIAPKEINGKGNLEFEYTVQETIELASPTDVEPKQGATFTELFSYDKGLPMAKDKLKKLCEGLGIPTNSSLADIVESVQGVGVEVTLKHRKNPKGPDPERVYANVPAATFKVV